MRTYDILRPKTYGEFEMEIMRRELGERAVWLTVAERPSSEFDERRIARQPSGSSYDLGFVPGLRDDIMSTGTVLRKDTGEVIEVGAGRVSKHSSVDTQSESELTLTVYEY